MAEEKDINLIAIKSLIEYIDNRDIAEGGVFLDDDNAEFVADILRYHYKTLTSENKMEQVAAMFGKELGEEFTVKHMSIINMSIINKVKLTDDGLEVYDSFLDNWIISSDLLEGVLTGQLVIVDE